MKFTKQRTSNNFFGARVKSEIRGGLTARFFLRLSQDKSSSSEKSCSSSAVDANKEPVTLQHTINYLQLASPPPGALAHMGVFFLWFSP